MIEIIMGSGVLLSIYVNDLELLVLGIFSIVFNLRLIIMSMIIVSIVIIIVFNCVMFIWDFNVVIW